MIRGKTFLFSAIAFITGTLPLYAHASLIPQATTSSNQTITAKIEGSSLLEGIVNAQTNTYAMAMSTNPDSLDYPAIHYANATAQVLIPNNQTAIATFNTAFSTSAKAFSSEPLFSRSAAIGQSSIYAWLSPTNSSALNLDWKFNSLSIQAEPTSTFAYMSNIVKVVQQTSSGIIQETVAGFSTFLENGKQTIQFMGDHAVTQTLKNWFDSNTTQTGNKLTLNNTPTNLSVNIALAQQQQPFFLGIENTHTEVSYEAPPVATNQIDEKLGYLASDTNKMKVNWDSENGILSFDTLPINTLTDILNKPDLDDPLYGGHLEIDPLQLITHADDRDYFSGKEIRLVDKDGKILYKASLPSLVFDDDLFEKQGFNLFAPILNVLAANPEESNWLNDYLAKSNINSLLLPELFIGFNTPNKDNNIWDEDFNAPVTSYLSFTGIPSKVSSTVSEPSEIMLFMFGFATLLLRQYRNHSVKL